MKGHPNSYLDPAYDRIESATEAKLGLPQGLLTAIRTKGERSDADQVSSSGARSVYQVTPETRRGALKKWGLDPWASAENAAEVAGLILKDSLNATKGDTVEAVARYHAGTEGARGPVNRAYVARVTGQGAAEATPAGRTSRAAVAPPRVVEAYNAGTMSAADRAAFDKALKDGQVRLPEGATLTAAPAKPDPGVAVVPQRVLDRYNNHSEMTDSQRDLIDRDVAAGNLRLPEGGKLARPGPRTPGESFGMGVRGIMTGAGGLLDLPGNALNSAVNLATGSPEAGPSTFRNLAESGADALGLAKPATSGEQFTNAMVEGGAQGLLTAGLATPAAGASGGVGAVARGLSAAPVLDTVSGGVSGGASEATRQAGGGPIAQLAAGMAGGLAPTGAAGVAERLAPKFGPKVAQVVETTPRRVLMDEAGQLTDEGREIVARAGVEPETLKAAYDDAATPQAEPGGRTVRVFEGVEHPVEVVGAAERNHEDGRDYVPVRTPGGQEGYVPADEVISKPAASPEAAPGNPSALPDKLVGDITSGDAFETIDPSGNVRVHMTPEETALLRKAGLEVSDDGVMPPRTQQALRDERAYRNGSAQRPGEASRGRPAEPTPEAPIPASAAARMAEAKSVGVDLTKGQATKDFETQAAESDLSGTNTAEGRQVREHLDRQTQAIKDAAEAFKATLGDTSLNAADRGSAVKAGLRDLADQGKAGVTQAYKLVRDLASELGDNAKGLTALDPAPIRAGVREILADDTVSDATRKGLAQIAAKYGLIGESPRHVPDTGMTTVMVRDAENNLVRGPAFAGKVEPLDLTNAEKFRQRLNDLYDKMATRNPQEALKPILDDAVAEAAERAAKEGFGDVGKAAADARDKFKAQKATFEAKDVVDNLISWKNGTQTDAVLPEKVWSLVFGNGPDALTNIKKLRAILLSKPTEASRAAWEAIKAQSVADLFQKALVVNGAGGEGAISGAKLNSAVQKFGPQKLKLILGDEQFNAFMKLKRVIADATIPLPKTTNPSGSGHLIARFLGNTAKGVVGAAKIVPGLGGVVDVVAGLAKTGAERTQAERVAKGATEFTPADAVAVDAKASPQTEVPKTPAVSPDEAIRQFLELGASNRLLAPLLASSAASQKEGDQ